MTSRVTGGDTSDAPDASDAGARDASGASDVGARDASGAGARDASDASDAGTRDASGASGAGARDALEIEGVHRAPAAGGDSGTAGSGDAPGRSRRPPALTTDTARPEGGGRAAAGGAPAPARQWPLLTVLGLAALGLLVVGTDLFPQAFRVGTILVGVALLAGAGLRRALPSVGMLAVRSRFTDMVTYGVMGALIVLLALMVQPAPWLKIPFLEDILHLTIT
ncbi:DUF3017 domain-containing protein [Streptomyces sp. NPDC057426]|uniref:DUF3017 domain-containing protein n=1 Tax=Streptomyces sp. NPDC057426 TaxID=3346128 RepID=UPI00368A3631